MKNNVIILLFMSVLTITSDLAHAQAYRTSLTEALENNGIQWIQKKLPPSVITFSDYSGQVEIKTALPSLVPKNTDSVLAADITTEPPIADFVMQLDKEQLQQQIPAGKSYTTAGTLTINNITKKAFAEYLLVPRNNPSDGFSISAMIRFNPADFNLNAGGDRENQPLIVKITSGYLNKQQNNF